MTWSKFDDVYDEHERIEDAWHAFPANPVGLHVMATTACNRWLSDGVIRPRWIAKQLPKTAERRRVLAYMLDAELLDMLPAGETREAVDVAGASVTIGPFDEPRYLVHDFLDRHESAQTVKAKRAKDAQRKREGRHPDSVGRPGGRPGGRRADSDGSPPHAPAGAPAPASRPDPTRPSSTPQPPQAGESFPQRPSGRRGREQARWQDVVAGWAGHHFPGAPPSKVAAAADHLRGRGIEPTPDALRELGERSPIWSLAPVHTPSEEAS